jgi:4-amino-4-deoxy-L-arabinose transferase-like glycosyltransferase
MIKKAFTNPHVLLWIIFILAFVLRAAGLSGQPPLDDEVAAAFSATNYLDSGMLGQVMWNHPPLRNFVVFTSGKLFGAYTAWGLRFGSVLFGSLTVLLLGYLGRTLFNNTAGYLSSFFLCIDPLHISLSREAFQESTTPFFIIAAVILTVYAIRKDNILFCFLSGLLFGLASASKWHGLLPWAASAATYFSAPWLLQGYDERRRVFDRLLAVIAAYGAVPIAVYTAAYLPWILKGFDIAEFVDFQRWLVVRQHYHLPSDYDQTFLSPSPYQWFLWPVAYPDFVFHQGRAYLTVSMGNLLVWGLTFPAVYYSMRRWWGQRSFGCGFALVMFLVSYLPLIFSKRGIWVFSAPAVIPFAFILSAYAVSALMDEKKISGKIVAGYLGLVLIVSALMYPMSTARTLEYEYLHPVAEIYSPHKGDGK